MSDFSTLHTCELPGAVGQATQRNAGMPCGSMRLSPLLMRDATSRHTPPGGRWPHASNRLCVVTPPARRRRRRKRRCLARPNSWRSFALSVAAMLRMVGVAEPSAVSENTAIHHETKTALARCLVSGDRARTPPEGQRSRPTMAWQKDMRTHRATLGRPTAESVGQRHFLAASRPRQSCLVEQGGGILVQSTMSAQLSTTQIHVACSTGLMQQTPACCRNSCFNCTGATVSLCVEIVMT